VLAWSRNQAAIDVAAATDGLYALATNLTGRLTAGQLLKIYKDQALVAIAHHNGKGPPRVRPIFLHNDDRIAALISTVGLALLVFGLIELDLRRVIGPENKLDGLLPEQRAARPTGRSILAAFQGLGLTYTADGNRIDRLTPPSGTSSNSSKSRCPGPNRASRRIEVRKTGPRAARTPATWRGVPLPRARSWG
jgi:transposase